MEIVLTITLLVTTLLILGREIPLAVIVILIGAGLVSRLKTMWQYWIIILASVLFVIVKSWFLKDKDNGEIVLFCWIVAICLALLARDPAKREAILGTNARYLVATCMLLAAISKLMSPQYLSGNLFEEVFLLDWRFEKVAVFLGQLTPAEITSNRQLIADVVSGSVAGPARLAISNSQSLWWAARIFTWWGLLLEILITIAFLFPKDRFPVSRHFLLLVFCVTTYSVVPIFGFGWVLLVLGMAHARQLDRKWLQTIYQVSIVFTGAVGLLLHF